MGRPLRLAYMIGRLAAGGAERQMLLLAEHLPKERFEVEFLTLAGTGELDERARRAGARVVPLGQPPAAEESRVSGLRRRMQMGASLLRVMQRRRYDVVDAWLYPADVLVALAGPLAGNPIIVSGRRNMGQHARFGPLSGPMDVFVNRLTDAVVANSQAAADNAIRHHHVAPTKMRVIRNGVVPIEPPPPHERRRMRAGLGAGDSEVLIACVGNLRAVKRHDLLLEAFAAIAAEIAEARLVLIGDGPMRTNVERQVHRLGLSRRVHIHGSMYEVGGYYPAFDIVVQASDSEGLPNVLLEAAAAGRAIVATDAGGSGEVVVDKEGGVLVPVGNASALADGIRRLALDVALRQRYGSAAREHVTTSFGVGRLVDEFVTLYEGLIAARHRR